MTLNCVANGNPQPTIQWFKDDDLLTGEEGSFLNIKKLNLKTRGRYKCNASNALGRDECEPVIVKIRGEYCYSLSLSLCLISHNSGLRQYTFSVNLTEQFITQFIIKSSPHSVVKRSETVKYAVTPQRLEALVSTVCTINSTVTLGYVQISVANVSHWQNSW